jgi:hypothetical protein
MRRPATAATVWPFQAIVEIVLARPTGACLRGRLSSNVRPHETTVMLTRNAAVALAFALAACSTPPPAPSIPTDDLPYQVEVVREGQFEVLGDPEMSAAPETAAGKVGSHDSVQLISESKTLKAVRGATFGFTYLIKGVPDGEVSGFEMRALHPPMTGPSGKTTTQVFGEQGVAVNDIIYVLAEPFEVLPGNWTLQLVYKGKAVVSRQFVLQ